MSFLATVPSCLYGTLLLVLPSFLSRPRELCQTYYQTFQHLLRSTDSGEILMGHVPPAASINSHNVIYPVTFSDIQGHSIAYHNSENI